MVTVPRDATGNFLPPQYRLDSVPATEVQEGDRIDWAVNGKAEVCVVVNVVPWEGLLYLLLLDPFGVEGVRTVKPDTTLNKVEVLRG